MTEPEFRDAFREHKDAIYRFAYRMTGSSSIAEDVVQDTFVALWRKPSAYDPKIGSLRPFLLGMARNVILKRWRSERPQESLDQDTAFSPSLDIENLARQEAIAQAVQALPPLQREAVILAEYEELSLEEIARTTGTELAAVKSRLHRGRENLRRTLAPLMETRRKQL